MLKKLAALGAAVAVAWALATAPANAASMTYRHLENYANTNECLDYRADYGPYTTTCNQGPYQTWLMATDPETAGELRQNVGNRLCLVARNGVPVMRTCVAGDKAALWTLHSVVGLGYQLVNKSTGTCLVAGSGSIHHVSLGVCSTGAARQWYADI
ncbi:hypothetical protein BIV57_00405 [Mangrovactinospora gilvigrisea]|uniref:Ricin B lectin domain-containing protein n=1 Tax=Mangrovactinospora gilvigrisea TaxID=1428644 RepID=A0A1J7BKY2_9ACTN|nr:ricin-type beta-trefoil lectin domain protein [Mangrovactinospora gilvigrisea]OIV39343.1 hypothetical protein BIV57_00405 [Mangrovactinospora gilvigrisea]